MKKLLLSGFAVILFSTTVTFAQSNRDYNSNQLIIENLATDNSETEILATYDSEAEILATENSYSTELEFITDNSKMDNYEDIEKFLVINRDFALGTNNWTTIGSENNTLNRTIRIANSSINRDLGNISVEVRDSNNRMLGFNTNIRPGAGINVNIPWNSGTYTIRAHAVSTSGTYNIVVSRQ